MDYFVWVVRNQGATIVVDTGFSRAAGDSRGRNTIIDPATLFDQLGVDRSRCTLVLTHAHYDHIGNLDLFPEAEVVVSRREVEFWNGPLRRKPLFHHSVEEAELNLLAQVAQEPRTRLFEGELDLAPGVQIIELGGHTPGMSALRVQTSAGQVLLASDAVHYYEELERDMPFSSVVDVAGMYSALERVRTMQASGKVDIVVPGHDSATLARLQPDVDPAQNVVVLGSAA